MTKQKENKAQADTKKEERGDTKYKQIGKLNFVNQLLNIYRLVIEH